MEDSKESCLNNFSRQSWKASQMLHATAGQTRFPFTALKLKSSHSWVVASQLALTCACALLEAMFFWALTGLFSFQKSTALFRRSRLQIGLHTMSLPATM